MNNFEWIDGLCLLTYPSLGRLSETDSWLAATALYIKQKKREEEYRYNQKGGWVNELKTPKVIRINQKMEIKSFQNFPLKKINKTTQLIVSHITLCVLYCKYLAAAAGVGTAQGANTSLAVLLLQVIVLRLDSPVRASKQQRAQRKKKKKEKKNNIRIVEIQYTQCCCISKRQKSFGVINSTF